MDASETLQLNQAVNLAQAGQKTQAYYQLKHLQTALTLPDTTLLFWLAFTSPDLGEATQLIRQIELLEPANPTLPGARDWLAAERAKRPAQFEPPPFANPYQPGPFYSPAFPVQSPALTAVAASQTAAGSGWLARQPQNPWFVHRVLTGLVLLCSLLYALDGFGPWLTASDGKTTLSFSGTSSPGQFSSLLAKMPHDGVIMFLAGVVAIVGAGLSIVRPRRGLSLGLAVLAVLLLLFSVFELVNVQIFATVQNQKQVVQTGFFVFGSGLIEAVMVSFTAVVLAFTSFRKFPGNHTLT